MPLVDVVVSSPVSTSMRVRQVEALFDVPAQEKQTLRWTGDVPLEARPWNVGLIVGPSGCGKSTVARSLFEDAMHRETRWQGASVIDDFPSSVSLTDVAAICQAVGFNTIPSWLRPFAVLSNGEQFRVSLARLLVECPELAVVDEFTSVVDRQVAKIGSHAVQKYVRAKGSKFVAVSCHSDIIDWLNPDWVLEPATMTFSWRSLQRRPPIDVEIRRVEYRMWRLFAPYPLSDGRAEPLGTVLRALCRPRWRAEARGVRRDVVSTAPECPQHLGTLAPRDPAGLPGAWARVRADRCAGRGVRGVRAADAHVSSAPGAHPIVRSIEELAPRTEAGAHPAIDGERRSAGRSSERGVQLCRSCGGGPDAIPTVAQHPIAQLRCDPVRAMWIAQR